MRARQPARQPSRQPARRFARRPCRRPCRLAAAGRSGFTLVELLIVVALLSILTAAVLPVVHNAVKRSKEARLEQALTSMRRAIDEYRRYTAAGLIEVSIDEPQDGYPPTLERLTEPIPLVNGEGRSLQLLRRIPVDPMTGEAEWGVRTYDQDPEDAGGWAGGSWGGEYGVYDVYSLSEGVGLKGVPYGEW